MDWGRGWRVRGGPGDTGVEGMTVGDDSVRSLRKNDFGLCEHLLLKPIC